MSLDDRTNQLKSIDFAGGGTFAISPEAAQQHYNAISYYRDALTKIKASIDAKLRSPWQSVGSLDSAKNVKSTLADDQPQALSDSLDKYLTYLDAYEKAIKDAYRSVHGVDMQFGPVPPAQPLPAFNPTEQLMLGPVYAPYTEFNTDLPIGPAPGDPFGLVLPTTTPMPTPTP